MRRPIVGVFILLLAWPALQAEDKPGQKPKELPANPAEQYKALEREFNDARQAFFKEYGAAKTDEERQKIVADKYPRPDKFAPRFMEFAEENPKDPAAVDALVWVVSHSNQGGGKNSARGKALAILMRDHASSPKIAGVCESLIYQQGPEAEAFLRAVLDKNPAKEAQARACLALALFLRNSSRGQKSKPEAEQAKIDKQVEELLERAVASYSDVKHPFYGTIGKKAEGELFEIRHLSVGKEAPDMTGEDQDGKKFKLSDYRGKVVLLDFWGNW
jgi:hypothetical protein